MRCLERHLTRQAVPVDTFASRCFPPSSWFMVLPLQLYHGLAVATLANRRRRLRQRSAVSARRSPGAGSATPSLAGGGARAGVGDAKPSPVAPARPVQRGRGAHFLRAPWDRTLHTPQRPSWERVDPYPATPTGRARLAQGAVRLVAGVGAPLVAILASPVGAVHLGPWDRSPRAQARRDPSTQEPGPPNSTAPARACSGFGEGGPSRIGTVTQPQRNRRVGTCRPGGRRRWWPRYRPALRGARPVPAAHAPCAPPLAASPEGACRP